MVMAGIMRRLLWRLASALLDLVEEPLDQVPRSVKVRAEADRLLAISFRRDVCPRAFLISELPDPVGVISAIREQSCSGLQFHQEN